MSPDELDRHLSEAMEALDATTPDGYFDELDARLEARFLEVEREMAGPTMVNDRSGDAAPDMPPPGAPATGDGNGTAQATDENSGLHDIKALAKTTKQRISRRVSTQSDVEESLLTSSSSALSTVALPDPQKETEQPVLATAAADTASTPAKAAAEDTRGGLPMWIYATVGAVAVAAVIFFVVTGGKSDSGDTVATADTAASGADDTASADPAATTPGDGDGDGAGAASDTEPGGLVPADDEGEVAESSEPDDEAAGEEEPEESAAEDEGDREVVASNDTPTARRDRDRATNRNRDRNRNRARTNDRANRANRGGGGGGAANADPEPAADKDDGSVGDKGGGGDSIEDLLAQASGGAADVDDDTPKEAAKPTKKRLTASDIKKGMQSIMGKVPACYDGEPGTVKVRFTVEPNGKVSSALPTGTWKSTKAGNCIAGLVRSVGFPAWDGRRKSYTYPFLLSQ